jgi:tRNA uridine 5-carbamoylmethylation protein Kti12
MKIILFRGRPGTGKTTLSEALAQQTNFSILRKDDIYDVTSVFIAEHDIRNKISYNALYKILESNSKNDLVFIVDYPFQYPGDLEIIKNWCIDKKVVLKSILVTCSDEKLWAQRFENRSKNPTPNQLITDFESFKKLYGTMQLPPEKDELFIDSINSLDSIIPQVIDFVKK